MYDVTAREVTFKKKLLENGFVNKISTVQKSYILPSNVVACSNVEDFEDIIKFFQELVDGLNVTESIDGLIEITQILIFEFDQWLGYP
jgi:hypothetical protein